WCPSSRISPSLRRWCSCWRSAPPASMAADSEALGGWRLPVLLVLAVFLLLVPPLLTSYWVGLFTQMVIFAILAMSLDVLLGYTGLPSLGHAAFFGVSAYAVAILATTYQANFWICVMGGILAGTLLSIVFGLIVSHVRDV